MGENGDDDDKWITDGPKAFEAVTSALRVLTLIRTTFDHEVEDALSSVKKYICIEEEDPLLTTSRRWP